MSLRMKSLCALFDSKEYFTAKRRKLRNAPVLVQELVEETVFELEQEALNCEDESRHCRRFKVAGGCDRELLLRRNERIRRRARESCRRTCGLC